MRIHEQAKVFRLYTLCTEKLLHGPRLKGFKGTPVLQRSPNNINGLGFLYSQHKNILESHFLTAHGKFSMVKVSER